MRLFSICPWPVGNKSQSEYQYHKMKKSLFKNLVLGKLVFQYAEERKERGEEKGGKRGTLQI